MLEVHVFGYLEYRLKFMKNLKDTEVLNMENKCSSDFRSGSVGYYYQLSSASLVCEAVSSKLVWFKCRIWKLGGHLIFQGVLFSSCAFDFT